MTVVQACALRRAAIMLAALSATVVAHGLSLAEWHFGPGAPVAWAGWMALAILAGGHNDAWRVHRLSTTVGAVVVLQAAVHLCLAFAPWLMGIATHGSTASISPVAVVAHALVAVALALMVRRGERALTWMLSVVGTITRRIERGPRRGAPPRIAVCVAVAVPGGGEHLAPWWCRGPPASK